MRSSCEIESFTAWKEADVETDVELRRKLVTFVVSGGGFQEWKWSRGERFCAGRGAALPRIPHEEIRCVLVHSLRAHLAGNGRRLALFAQKILAGRGVELRLGDRLVAATSEKAILKSGAEILSKTIVSTVPSAMPPRTREAGCAKEKGRLLVNEQLALKGHEGQVWAVGDCAFIKTVSGTQAPPPLSTPRARPRPWRPTSEPKCGGGNRTAFAFEGLGKLGALGPQLRDRRTFSASRSRDAAWLLWRTIYLMKLPGINTRSESPPTG